MYKGFKECRIHIFPSPNLALFAKYLDTRGQKTHFETKRKWQASTSPFSTVTVNTLTKCVHLQIHEYSNNLTSVGFRFTSTDRILNLLTGYKMKQTTERQTTDRLLEQHFLQTENLSVFLRSQIPADRFERSNRLWHAKTKPSFLWKHETLES